MKPMNTKNSILWGIIMTFLLAISYLLSRFYFFDLHGMKQWPNLLAIIGVTIIAISTVFHSRIILATTVVGYMIGFLLAMIFNTDGLDSGGGRTNNAWIIWTSIFIFSILIGFVLEFFKKDESNE